METFLQADHASASCSLTNDFDVVIVGAGAAGVGCAILLQELDIQRFCLLERETIGASFRKWPEEMRLITPSFPSNQFGLLDLNAVALNTSPAYSLKKEHLSGAEYAQYLQGLVEWHALPVVQGVDVFSLQPSSRGDGFLLHTSSGEVRTRFVIWAAGEFSYPRLNEIEGAHACLHTSQVRSWRALEGEAFLIIGGYESGIDAAVHLIAQGKTVVVLGRSVRWESDESDPSISLSPYTQERLAGALTSGRLYLMGDTEVRRVSPIGEGYLVEIAQGKPYVSLTPPLLATGFRGSLELIHRHVAWDETHHVLLTEEDESTVIPGLFVAGSQLRHDTMLFCFIYKFRQRFAVVVNAIAQRLGVDTSLLERYRQHQMFLDDLSCCRDECSCE
jgi:putative flavoprotein involved in K+ transport